MSEDATGATTGATATPGFNRTLAILLAMAMFVLVVDTSLMNVSISAVVRDLDTTVSGVQSAIALEALVSAAFILIGSKVGDLIGRKRAYVLGLLGYAVGALAMTLAQSLTAVIIFWAVHRRDRRVAAAARRCSRSSTATSRAPAQKQGLRPGRRGGGDRRGGRAAARRLHHHLPVLAGRVPAGGRHHRRSCSPASGWSSDVPYTGARARSTSSARSCRSSGMGGIVLGILVWQEGGEAVGALIAARRRRRWSGWSTGCVAASAPGRPTLLDPALFSPKLFRVGISEQMLQQIALGGLMIALPIYLQMVLEYNAMQAGPVARAAVAEHVRGGRCSPASGPASGARRRSSGSGSCCSTLGVVAAAPDRAAGRLRLVPAASR